MISTNLKQFGIKHLLAAFVLVSISMGLIATKWSLAVSLGFLILVGVAGSFSSFVMMSISDLIDDRRIDDRNLASRFSNCLGLLILAVTALTVVTWGAMLMLQLGLWLLEEVPPVENAS